MKAEIVAQRLQKQFPNIKGIKVRKDDFGHMSVHLGNAAEGGTIQDKGSKLLDKEPDLAKYKGTWGAPAADYYGEFHNGYPYIHPELKAAVEKYGYHIEWQNPGEIVAYQD